MANNIVQRPSLPRAIAKENNGIVLYWVEELQVAGIHQRGIMRLLQTESATVHNVIASLEAVRQISVLEAETVTPQGLRTVQLVAESDLPKVLRKIEHSRVKESVRDLAGDYRDKLAAAGFKLLVMLELAPHQLKAQIDQHVTDLDKYLEIERLKTQRAELDSTMLTMHGSAWLALQGVGIAETKIVVTEVVEPATGYSTEILTADQLKRVVKERTGQNLRSLKSFTDALRAAGRDDLLIAVTRHNTNEYPIPSRLDEAISIVYSTQRQRLVGEA